MRLHRFTDSQEFSYQVQDYLFECEAEHNLLLGILHNLVHYPERYSEPAYLACVLDSVEGSNQIPGKILAVAIQTPPFKLVLSKVVDLEAVTLIAKDLQMYPQPLPGVGGLVAEVEAFLQAWQTLTGQPSRRVMEMRIHTLTEVKPVAEVKGQLRVATESDRPLLLDWVKTFADEIGEVVSANPQRVVEHGLKQQSMYLWEDGTPVSWASGSRSLPKAARIGPVYTPPEYRRKGYATACVAALSQKLLNEGCDRCFLFTDLANPTSNHIYQQIGYQPICDWHEYAFDDA
ncbi:MULTISPECIES: GNAT family N-acetyltransferase [unclassified Leptolyngbya]|uniref:GNAT family N-acetyltransferase n=1 Tax=unclassified Leptolyngbya TaxID=2650499 RepID=UPI001682A0AF|nr:MULTISPECIES: GNAT family N-acetyltransferase [unclassified Leptolyngbya]MBD1913991.1 GNAT family N-acetyltransferase [Leptolyngbya sp. FACHB-8]MBD2154401.1 GNAT family N-acetyltransferase [Leptolyngbya sp. FACHB-16]